MSAEQISHQKEDVDDVQMLRELSKQRRSEIAMYLSEIAEGVRFHNLLVNFFDERSNLKLFFKIKNKSRNDCDSSVVFCFLVFFFSFQKSRNLEYCQSESIHAVMTTKQEIPIERNVEETKKQDIPIEDRGEFQESKAEMFISYSRGFSLFYI